MSSSCCSWRTAWTYCLSTALVLEVHYFCQRINEIMFKLGDLYFSHTTYFFVNYQSIYYDRVQQKFEANFMIPSDCVSKWRKATCHLIGYANPLLLFIVTHNNFWFHNCSFFLYQVGDHVRLKALALSACFSILPLQCYLYCRILQLHLFSNEREL